jgi:hypothetical protein
MKSENNTNNGAGSDCQERLVRLPDRSESYLPCRCGSDCNWLTAYPDEPCWGQVDKQDEDPDGNESHGCQGHRETLDWCCNSATARKYIPETNVQEHPTAGAAGRMQNQTPN